MIAIYNNLGQLINLVTVAEYLDMHASVKGEYVSVSVI